MELNTVLAIKTPLGLCEHITSLEEHDNQIRAEAIDDFADTLSKINWDSIISVVDVSSFIKNVAEQLKEKK